MPSKTLHFSNPRLISQLYANDVRNLDQVEQLLNVDLVSRDDWIRVEGAAENK